MSIYIVELNRNLIQELEHLMLNCIQKKVFINLLNNLTSRLKLQFIGPSVINIGQFIQWCNEHSIEPTDADTVFVVDY